MDLFPDEILERIIDEAFDTFYPLHELYEFELVSKRFRRLAVSVYVHRGHCLYCTDSVYRMMDRGLIDETLEDMQPLHLAKQINLIKLEECGIEIIRYFVRRWQTRHLILSHNIWRHIRKILPECHNLTTVTLGAKGLDRCDLIDIGSILSSCKLIKKIVIPAPKSISVQELQKADVAWRTVPSISVGGNLPRSVLPALSFFLEKTAPSYLHVSSVAIRVEQALSGLLTDSIKSKLKHLRVSGRAPFFGLPIQEDQGFLDGIPEVTIDWRLGVLAYGGPQYVSNPQLRLGRTLHIGGSADSCKCDRDAISALEETCLGFWETVECNVNYTEVRMSARS